MVVTLNKIDTSNFKFIEVKDQYMLGMAVKTSSSNKYINFFSQESDLISYVDVSYPGFMLPAVEVIFSFSDRQLFPYLSEKNVFVISIGKDLNSQIQSTFNIITSNINQKAEGKWTARIVGIYDKLAYMKMPKKAVYANTSSEVAKQVFQEELGVPVKAKVDVRSKDNMFWLRPNQSSYAFLHNLWMHSYIPNSMWFSAISFEGKPIITDLRKQAKDQPKVMLTTGPSNKSSNVYSVLDNFDVNDNSSLNNSFGGYDKYKPIYNLDEARKNTLQRKESVLLASTDEFNKALGIETEASYTIQNSNVHQNYYASELNNKNMLLTLKSFQIEVTAEGEFVPVELLDYVVFKDIQPDRQAQEDYSGIYLVGKIAHQIANKKVYTHITLWRESQNHLASASKADQAQSTDKKMDNVENEINTMNDLMTPETYNMYMNKCETLRQQIEDYKLKVQDAISDSEVYKAYKALNNKYRSLMNYVYTVSAISTSLTTLFPFMNEVTNKINSITIDTPFDEVNATVRQYLNVQKYIGDIETKITDKVNSNAIYSNYLSAKSEYNQMTSTIRSLQSMGIIGDLDEYTES